ncbi:UDP-N-acetylglucosamine 2-epimerase (non-hydrolyzing) [bacterium]|nr:UDP-N-acetylglucosamine 2-epimerase (non-hydrolyzing) [bacterium]
MTQSVFCVVGARPQFIKHKPVVEAFRQHFKTLTVHTSQHYDHNMSKQFFEELQIPEPDFILEDTSRTPRHGAQTASMLISIEDVLMSHRPDAVVVYGDTNSTLAGALAASKLGIPLVHIEAGLRSFNRAMPEEINRVLTDHISNLLFAPTQTAVDNLRTEGVTKGVHNTGDVMCDVLKSRAAGLTPKKSEAYAFATIHRPYNTDDPARLKEILEVLNGLPYGVVLPIHPRTRGVMQREGLSTENFPKIAFIEPVGYQDCLAYQKFSECVITDSGGIQKEAYLLEKRCITMRTETEWLETLENGCNTLVGDDLRKVPEILQHGQPPRFGTPYGVGDSAQRMAQITFEYLNRR